MDIKCPECHEVINIENNEWECIGLEFTCSTCNTILKLNYDEGEYFFEVIC